jgi:hypothetical protein
LEINAVLARLAEEKKGIEPVQRKQPSDPYSRPSDP